MPDQTTQITPVGLDGGLNLKTEPQRLSPPATTRADNAWHVQPGNVQQLPPFYSLFNDAPTPYPPLHVYNLATRDLSSPAPTGDLLVHGEYNDTGSTVDVGNTATGFTRPLWAYNTARTVSYEQACLPFSLRVRPLSSPLALTNVSGTAPTVYGNQLLFAREEGTPARRRFLIGAIQNYVFQATSGYADGLSRSTTFSYGSNLVGADMLGVQNSAGVSGTNGYAALLAVGSSTTTLYSISYNGGQVASVTIPTIANYNAPNAQLFHHAGRTYCGYTGSSSNTAVMIRDIVAGTAQQTTSSGTTTAINLAFSSPYTHQAQTSVSYLAMVYNGSLYVLALSAGIFNIVAGPVALATPAVAVSGGTYNYAATVQAMVADTQGGVGASAKLVIAVFSHFPEVAKDPGFVGAATAPGYQSILCSKFIFQAATTNPGTAAGTLANLANNVFRTPAGAGLVSKAFCSNPPEANYAGPTAGKHALVCVQSGAVEPDATQVYNTSVGNSTPYADRDSQPTYFFIDHNADIVGRFLEGLAATRPAALAYNYTGTSTRQPAFPGVQSLANPLFSDGTGDDVATLNITVPVWGALNPIFGGTYASPYTSTVATAVIYQTRRMASYTYTPQAATLSYGTAAPPAINVGSHTYISGACPMVHDGNGLVEQNFHFGAPNIVLSATNQNNTYGYYVYAIYNWYDAQGRLHRSQPSLASTITSAVNTNAFSLTYYFPLMPSNKPLVGQPIFVELYMSLADNVDDTGYLISTFAMPALSKTTAQPVMFVSASVNATQSITGTVAQQPAMYTSPNKITTGRTYYAAPPRCSFWQVAAKGRCFSLVQINGQYRMYYSNVASDVVPFEFNPLNYAMVPPDIGDARSLEAIDDKIVVLGTRGNAVMTGDGPATSGSVSTPTPNDGFSPVTPIPVPAGVIGTGAPARIPDGIIYQGYSGIQVIGRDLSITAAGANVDVLTGRQIGNVGTLYGKGVTLPTLQAVVWPNPRGAALVYGYLTQKWSTWPLLPNATVLAQKMDGNVYVGVQPIVGTRLTPYGVGTTGADVGYLGLTFAPISGSSTSPGLVLETPWVLLAGSSTGEADLYDMALIGTWQGSHTLKVEQAYNYGAYTLAQTLDMTVQPLTYQTRWRPLQNSRVWAVRYRVSLLPISTLNAGYAMAELADLVVYSTVQAGTTRVGQGMTR